MLSEEHRRQNESLCDTCTSSDSCSQNYHLRRKKRRLEMRPVSATASRDHRCAGSFIFFLVMMSIHTLLQQQQQLPSLGNNHFHFVVAEMQYITRNSPFSTAFINPSTIAENKSTSSHHQRIVDSKLHYENDRNRISLDETLPTTASITTKLKHTQRMQNLVKNTRAEEEDVESSTNNKVKRKQQQQQTFQEYENNKLDIQLLLIDNYDSYTYNLYSYLCTMCKHKPIVISNDAFSTWDELVQNIQLKEKKTIDGIIISPGPGRPERPEDMGVCIEAIEKNPDIPILGVCLGHQALGYYYNASVALAPCGPIHGLTSKVWFKEEKEEQRSSLLDKNIDSTTREQEDDNTATTSSYGKGRIEASKATKKKIPITCNLFRGIPQLFDVVRYHSLVVEFPSDVSSLTSLDIEPTAWCNGNPATDNLSSNGHNLHTDKHLDGSFVKDESVCMALQHKIHPHYGVQFHPESVGTGEVGYQILENFCQFCMEWQEHQNQSLQSITKPKDKMNGKANDIIVKNDAESSISDEQNKTGDQVLDRDTSSSKSKYKVYIHKVKTGNPDSESDDDNLPLPETVFEEMFASLDTSFWLDSSTGRKNADLDDLVSDNSNKSQSTQTKKQCPIVTNSRFSIMGSNDGPLSKKIEYWGYDHPTAKRGIYLFENNDDTPSDVRVESDLMSFLHNELSSDGIVKEAMMLDFESYDSEQGNKPCLVEATTDIPFEYRGGYVGYLGYEVRHDTRQAICKQEICNVSQKQYSDDNDQSKNSNSNLPTAAFVFADRSLLYDHWRGDWYVIGVAKDQIDNQSSAIDNKTNVSTDNVLKWMHMASGKVKNMGRTISSNSNTSLQNNKSYPKPLDFSLVRSKDQYIKDISRCHDEIKNGESYELCLTNQFQAEVSLPVGKDLDASPFGLYKILRKKNPAPFASFLNFNGNRQNEASFSICCSSPERFLSISKKSMNEETFSSTESHGWEFAPPFVSSITDDSLFVIESKPIKGTSKRIISQGDDEEIHTILEKDAQIAEELRTSVKNRAENLMIVDLLRNDLSRVCEPGSVHVPKLMAIESFATVHQMVSTIRGIMKPSETPIDVISACFPGGSMTGAPKLRSIDILNEIELGESRGPYSGCLGYISLNGCMDLNIIIRTAVLTSKIDSAIKDSSNENIWNIAIGAGGAITAMSESEDEFDEMQLKSRAVKEAVQLWSDDNTKV